MKYRLDNDMHCHTHLSLCSGDPAQTAEAVVRFAEEHGYAVQCITDHLWDEEGLPGAPEWYARQDIAHVRSDLPLPRSDKVRVVFGCETEMNAQGVVGVHPSHFGLFDFIVIPPNHFHMEHVRDKAVYNTEKKVADYLVERLEAIGRMDLPFYKVGIAHINCSLIMSEGDQFGVYDLVDEGRYRAAMRTLADKGAGIELNAASFVGTPKEKMPSALRLFRMAKEEGCRFYLASDAHHPAALGNILRIGDVIDALGLTEDDKFRLA